MAVGLASAIRAVVQEKGISEELLMKVIEEFLLAAYKRKYGHADNAVVQFTDEGDEVTLYAQKTIVNEVEDEVMEIALSAAQAMDEDAEVGDELLIEIDPQDFDRVAIQTAKQRAKQRIREIQKDTLYSEFSQKTGELVIGYVQRERNGNLFIDLGKAEGILPKRYQSPREAYRTNDRIKALIVDVVKGNSGLQIALSRTHSELVKRVFELEVPEVYAGTVEIVRIVREAGYRTKIAVASNREDVDPVGACVGLRGVRIQAIVRELEGEKIDILKYDPDPRVLIKNALSPAEVTNVVVLDETRRQALAIVPNDQLSLAIGKQGLNVRLANRLADWNIDVKTMEQFADMDVAGESKRAVSVLFGDYEEDADEISAIAELPGITTELVEVLEANNLTMIEEIVGMSDEEFRALDGMNDDLVRTLSEVISENVEIVEGEEEEYEDDQYEDEAYEDEQSEQENAEDRDEYQPDEREEAVDETATVPASEEDAVEDDETDEPEDEDEEEVITEIDQLPSMTPEIVSKLANAGVNDLEDLINVDPDSLSEVEGLTEEEAETIRTILTEYVEIVEGEEE